MSAAPAPPRFPAPTATGSRRPWLVAAAALGACAVVNVVDPNEQGSLGICPFKLVTGGLDCPGCGTLRATRALTRGDLALAADHNLLFVLVVPLLLWGLVGWIRSDRTARPRPQLPATLAVAFAAVVPVFWLVRNLDAVPLFTWLGSGAL